MVTIAEIDDLTEKLLWMMMAFMFRFQGLYLTMCIIAESKLDLLGRKLNWQKYSP